MEDKKIFDEAGRVARLAAKNSAEGREMAELRDTVEARDTSEARNPFFDLAEAALQAALDKLPHFDVRVLEEDDASLINVLSYHDSAVCLLQMKIEGSKLVLWASEAAGSKLTVSDNEDYAVEVLKVDELWMRSTLCSIFERLDEPEV